MKKIKMERSMGSRKNLLRAGVQALAGMGLWYVKRRGKATLAFEEIVVPPKEGDKVRTAMVMHGLMGSGRNWRTLSKRLATTAVESSPAGSAGWRMVLVDLRNHGQSANLPEFMPPHDIPAAARDVADLIKSQSWGWPDVMISHSLGGKVVLDFVQKAAAGSYGTAVLPRQLWILDSVPGEVPMEYSDGEVERVLATLESLPRPIPSRRWLSKHMVELGFSKGLADWLGSNLKRTNLSSEEMEWVFNVKGAHDMFASYRNLSYWSVLEEPPHGTHIAMVRAIKSDRWTSEILARLEGLVAKKSGGVSYHILENAGHWLHTDNPDGLIDILAPSLVNISK